MSTYVLTFISADGGVEPDQSVGNLGFARGLIRLWDNDPEFHPDCDRVCVLEVPSPSARKRTGFKGHAHVFTREEAARWADISTVKQE